MACDIATAPGNQVFSPLTLFECTVTNAQMLVESMADRELLRALKIANSLHTHIVGIMEPRYDRVCQRSDEHETCPPKAKLVKLKCDNGGATVVAKVEAASSNSPTMPIDGSNETADGGSMDESHYGYNSQSVDNQQFLDDGDNDCLLVEDSASEGILGMSTGSVVAGGAAASSSTSSGLIRRRQRRLPRRSSAAMTIGDEDPDSGVGLAAANAASASAGQTDVAALCKGAIHLAYKELKGAGPHLFDFNLPFSDPTNSSTAEQVIARAMQLQPNLDVPMEVWWSQLCPVELNRLARSEKLWRQRMLMRRLRSKDSKLIRRQKSFELKAGTLNAEEFDKFRVILSRDYTSSDEEVEDFQSASASTSGSAPPLRVRELPWESAEMADIKRRLDAAYLDSCATAKQAEQLRRVARGTGCLSVRAPPADCPTWAIRRDDVQEGAELALS